MSSNRRGKIGRLVASSTTICLLLSACVPLAVNNSDPMGIRELEGRVQLLLCSPITLDRATIVVRQNGQQDEGRPFISWTGELEIGANEVIDLVDTFLPAGNPSLLGFDGMGLDESSELDVILYSSSGNRGNQSTTFRFENKVPSGLVWLGSEGSSASDPCIRAGS